MFSLHPKIDAETLKENYKVFLEDRSPAEEKKLLGGMVLMTSVGFFGSLDRHLVIPAKPRFFHRAISYVALKLHLVFFVRMEERSIGYAFSCNAREVFSW